MKGVIRYPRFSIAVSVLVAGIFLLTRCIQPATDKSGTALSSEYLRFAGSETCISCHKNIYDTHIHTAHYLTSRPADKKYIMGNFDSGRNIFSFDPETVVAMEKRGNHYYQVEYANGVQKLARRFDIVTGSGTKGQTYLNWGDNHLYQLPITYFSSAAQWSNSPGYPGRPVFNRPITSRCLECHSTYVQKISAPGAEPEDFDSRQMIYGVDCEKCHGPAARHVEFQKQNPKETTGRYIINPASLSRQQNLDLCRLCHGGRLSKTTASFAFQPGDTLSNYFTLDTAVKDADNIDVHGNQYGLMVASKCFRMSRMTCNTCHNTHENEAGKIELFSQRCISCHSSGHEPVCRLTRKIGPSINLNCIDCHMPVKPSRAIEVFLQGNDSPTPAKMRSHYIRIYPDETKKFLASLHDIK